MIHLTNNQATGTYADNMVKELQYSTVTRLTHNPRMQITSTRISDAWP